MVGDTQLVDILITKYGPSVLAAIITGLLAYFTGVRLEARKNRKTLKQLSWDMDVDSRLVEVKDELKERVQVYYGSEGVENLTTVVFRVTNTGGAPVFNEFIRFAFPERARMLEVALDPEPAPELDVSEVTDADVPSGNRRFRIGQLEPGQSVDFRFVSDGGDWAGWTGIYPKNEQGGVAFQRRVISRVRADQEHVRPFVIQVALLIIAQLVFSLSSGLFIDDLVQFCRIAVTLLIAGLMLPHLLPVARILERIAVRNATGESDGNLLGDSAGSAVSHVTEIHGSVVSYSSQAGSEGDTEQAPH